MDYGILNNMPYCIGIHVKHMSDLFVTGGQTYDGITLWLYESRQASHQATQYTVHHNRSGEQRDVCMLVSKINGEY